MISGEKRSRRLPSGKREGLVGKGGARLHPKEKKVGWKEVCERRRGVEKDYHPSSSFEKGWKEERIEQS